MSRVIILLCFFFFVQGTSFAQKKFKKTRNGLNYKILADSAGKNMELGDAAVLHIKYANAKDTLNTFKRAPITVLVQETFKGGLEEGLLMLSKGDSAIFRISSDSLYILMFKDVLPKEIKPGSFTDITVKVLKIYTKEEVRIAQEEALNEAKEMKKRQMDFVTQAFKNLVDTSREQMKVDEELIKAFVKKNKPEARRTENGVYYAIKKKGEGPQVSPGDTVAVYYSGKLLNGTAFDSLTTGQPINFIVGIGQVIPGWDEGLTKLGKGDVATLIIPSPLAYGKMGIKDEDAEPETYIIPPNTPLIFDVEILDIKK
jgi:FKBP-type peptidyl-prolyl cis-trans isomerase FkpA